MARKFAVMLWAAACAAILLFAPFHYRAHNPVALLVEGNPETAFGVFLRPAWSTFTPGTADPIVQAATGDAVLRTDSVGLDAGTVLMRLAAASIVLVVLLALLPSGKPRPAPAGD